VIGWITGLFGAATGGTEQLQIMPDSYIKIRNTDTTNTTTTDEWRATLLLHILNRGGDVTIYKIETCRESVTKLTYTTASTEIDPNTVATWSTGDAVIESGKEVWLAVKLKGSYSVGTMCDVKIYTKAGNVFAAQVTVKK